MLPSISDLLKFVDWDATQLLVRWMKRSCSLPGS